MQASDRRMPALELMVLMAVMLFGTGSPVRRNSRRRTKSDSKS